jgi:hypothetical protein
MKSEEIKIEGEGVAEDTDDVKKLPPLPDQAVEYGAGSRNPLEDIVSELAEPAEQTYQVSDIDDNSIDITDAVIEESKNDKTLNQPTIIKVAEVVTAPDSKEFVPKIQDALSDDESEGGIAKAKIRGATAATGSDKFIKPAQAINMLGNRESDFNPGTVQSALDDESVEGGIISNKSTGPMISDGDASKEGFQFQGAKEEEVQDKYRVYGFTVQYRTEDGSLVTRPVSDFFNDLEIATVSINGKKYLMPMVDMTYKVVNIVSGVPEISFQDQRIYRYSDGVWTKT